MNPIVTVIAASMLITEAPAEAGQHISLEEKLEQAGYVDVAKLDGSIVVSLMYARPDNFVGEIMYTDLKRAYLHPEAAEAVVKAQQELHKIHPDYNLKICDASRPMSVQKRMYNKVRGTSQARYVSNPARGGGLHNYGLAVDVTIVDADGKELPMGTAVDHLGPESNIDREEMLVASGKITRQHRSNRQLLRRVMQAGGFKPLKSEWWHFNLRTRAQAKARYKLIDF